MDINYYKQFEPIDGKWYINQELGSGAFGKVFEIERRDFSNIKAALKVVSVPNSQSEFKSFRDDNFDMDDKSVTSYFYGFVEEFVKEFQVMSRLKGHTNIVSYEDHDVKEKKDGFGWDIFIRMELLTPMNEYFRMNTPRQSDVIKIGIDICKALEVCQKYNIIHRDIKPSNIFVSENGDFKLGDFGVARTLEKTSSGLSKKGTYTYMAPEVFKGEKYNSNVDIYSLGILMYKLLNSNMEPFRTDKTYSDGEKALSMRMNGEEIPAPSNAEGRLAEIVLKACRYNPKERYESPVQMRTELEKILYNKEESKLAYPNGDQLDYEASTGTSEKEMTVSMYSDDVAENTIDTLDEENKADKTVSMFSDETKDSQEKTNKEYCTNCGQSYKVDEKPKFCTKCGKKLEIQECEKEFCPNCGKTMFKTALGNAGPREIVCSNCGWCPDIKSNSKRVNGKVDDRNIIQLYIDFWKAMFDFKGNINRRDYWLTILANAMIAIPLMIVSKFVPFVHSIYSLYMIASCIAGTAINTRRLHDTGRSGHWQWLYLTVYGSIAVLVFLCMESKKKDNKFC